MKKFIVFLSLILSVFAEDSKDNNKNKIIPQVLGVGTYSQNSRYYGGKDMLSLIGIVQYENLYLQGSELGYKIHTNKDIVFVPYIKYDLTEGFEKGEITGVNELVDETGYPLDLGVKVTDKIKNLTLEFNYFRDFTSEANNVKLKLAYTLKIFEFLYFLPSISGIYNDKNYVNHYYGISEKNSDELNYDYKKLNGAFRGELELGGMMFFSPNIGTYIIYNLEVLDKKNVNDLLVKNTVNNRFIFTVLYRF